jgi:tetratricopeptide (TPR) repeat protein
MLLWMGRLHEVLGNVDEAIAVYERYASANPEDQTALVEMAEVLVHAGRLKDARASYERAELLDPGDATPLVGLADVALREGGYSDARRHLEAAESIARVPQQTSEVVRGWIEYHRARGQMNAVVDLVDRLYEVDRAYQQPINLLMSTYVQYARDYPAAGQTERGREILSRLQADFEPPLDGLADVGFMMLWTTAGDAERGGEYTDRVDAFLRRLQQERYDYSVELARARLAELAGDLEAAVSHTRGALDRIMRSVSVVEEAADLRLIRLTLVDYLIRSGEPAEAGAILDDHLKRYPADPVASLRVAEIARARGDEEAARAALARALGAYEDADPAYPPAAAARALALELGLVNE